MYTKRDYLFTLDATPNNLDILEERIMDIKRKLSNAANIMGIEKLLQVTGKANQRHSGGSGYDGGCTPVCGQVGDLSDSGVSAWRGTNHCHRPLLSLMHDQVRKLREHGVGAAHLDSTMKKSEQKECLQKFIRSEVKMLFITPERFIKEEFLCTMKAVAVYMVVVD